MSKLIKEQFISLYDSVIQVVKCLLLTYRLFQFLLFCANMLLNGGTLFQQLRKKQYCDF